MFKKIKKKREGKRLPNRALNSFQDEASKLRR
jgi:hypothetical protein